MIRLADVNYDMVVTANSGLNYRTGPGIQYEKLGAVPKGTPLHCTKCENGWYFHGGGWSDGRWLELTKDYGGSTFTDASNNATQYTPPQLSDEEEEILNTLHVGIKYTSNELDSIRYIYGAPMQFTALTDPRPENSEIGRAYLETMLTDMSMLVITPGKADFMKHFGESASRLTLWALLGNRDEDDADTGGAHLKDLLEGKETGRYYTFSADYTEYMKYVNNMCRTAALLLDIGDKRLFKGSEKYSNFDWDIGNLSTNDSSSLFQFLTEQKSITFFIDGKQSSFSDGMSNSTGESMLASSIGKTASDYVKEAMFLFGKGYQDDAIIDTSKTNYESAVEKVMNALTNKSDLTRQVADRTKDYSTTLINGGNIAFPEIWKDSSYSKSYNIEIKLVSPYADPESFYLYILVPVFHLIALSYPRQLGANGYNNPFLVRAFCKGWFNCSMGMIDSISIKRASQEGWSVEGYPTEVDVSISIRDLYQNLSLSREGDWSTFSNVEFLDMISTWVGVNINKPEKTRTLLLLKAFLGNYVPDFIHNIFGSLHETISDKIRGMFGIGKHS